ncbi:MAG: ribose 5-phosphate isomerase B [Bacteroidota bacterium]
MASKLITEHDVLQASRKGTKVVSVDERTIITPSARDAATRLNITFSASGQSAQVQSKGDSIAMHRPTSGQKKTEILALGSDHGGFAMKELLRAFLLESGYTVADVGTHSAQPCDYPDYAYAVASMVAQGSANRGIMIDSVGIASAIVCNKVPGVRAAAPTSEFAARSSREHNDANVLTLGGKTMGIEQAKTLVSVWLETWFGGGRHQTRLKKIEDLEQKFSRRS